MRVVSVRRGELPSAGLKDGDRGGDWAVVVDGLGKVQRGEDAAHVRTDRPVLAHNWPLPSRFDTSRALSKARRIRCVHSIC